VDELEPINAAEMLLRRVHKQRVKLHLPRPVLVSAFEPNKWDTDGLSFFRERFCDVTGALRGAKVAADNYIVRLPVADVLRFGVSLVINVDPETPGHVLAPEINFSDFEADPKRWFEAQVAWAEYAGRNILHHAASVEVPRAC
jgi:hypothetical protein